MNAASASSGADLWFESCGARLRYRDEGRGPAVLLIHGWTLDLEQWDPQVEALHLRHRLVRFDRRGFGLSTGSPSLAADADDALALCDHLGVRRFAVVGMSQGARVAVRLAAAAPGRIAALVLDGAPASIASSGARTAPELPLDEFRALLRDSGIEAFRAAWRRHPMAQLRTAEPRAHALLAKMEKRYRGLDLSMPEPAPGAAPAAPALATIHVPVLVMAGALDVASRRSAAAAICSELPGARLFMVPEAGHLANLDNPTAYDASLIAFLDGDAAFAAD